MQRLEELKQELLKQKEIITKKGGKVTVLNSNPSPSEITAGINSIISSNIDFSLVTATNDDVKKGKTYYNNMGELQTGNFEDVTNTFLLYNKSQLDSQTEYEFVMPSQITEVREGLFYNFPSKLKIHLDPKTTTIYNYALNSSSGGTTLENFNELTSLSEVKEYGLMGVRGIDLSNLPPNLTKVGRYSFCDTYYGQTSVKITSNITSCGEGCFSASDNNKATLKSVDLSGLTAMSEKMFSNVYFDFHFVLPINITLLAGRCFFKGGVKTAVIHNKISAIGDGTFFTDGDKSFMEYIEFQGEKPPYTVGTIFNILHKTKFTIYVPENSVEEYQNKFSGFIVKSVTEKP